MSAAGKAKAATPKAGGKSLGSGARHQQLTTRKASGASDDQKSREQLTPGYVKTGRATDNDVDVLRARYRIMHGRDPSPQQLSRIRRAK